MSFPSNKPFKPSITLVVSSCYLSERLWLCSKCSCAWHTEYRHSYNEYHWQTSTLPVAACYGSSQGETPFSKLSLSRHWNHHVLTNVTGSALFGLGQVIHTFCTDCRTKRARKSSSSSCCRGRKCPQTTLDTSKDRCSLQSAGSLSVCPASVSVLNILAKSADLSQRPRSF